MGMQGASKVDWTTEWFCPCVSFFLSWFVPLCVCWAYHWVELKLHEAAHLGLDVFGLEDEGAVGAAHLHNLHLVTLAGHGAFRSRR